MQSSPKHMSLTRPLGSESPVPEKRRGTNGREAESRKSGAYSEPESHDWHDVEQAGEKRRDEAEVVV